MTGSKMDYEVMLAQHVDSGTDVTVGCIDVPRMEATGFGSSHMMTSFYSHTLLIQEVKSRLIGV